MARAPAYIGGSGDRQRNLDAPRPSRSGGVPTLPWSHRPRARSSRASASTRPSSTDKNRAFWYLQGLGWSGYFILRSLSGFANSMGAMWLVHTALLTATGYSLTLLMGALFRRLIKLRVLWTALLSLAAVVLASTVFSVIETWSYATFLKPDSRPMGFEYLGAILLNFSLLAAWTALYYGINYYILLEEQIHQRERLESQASLAQLAMLRYQLNPHFLFNTLNSISTLVLLKQTERANAMLARLSSFLRYTLGQRIHRQGDAGAGGGDAEALPRDREDALRGPDAPALQDRIGDDRRAAAVAAAAAADRKCDQICGDAERDRRRHLADRAARRAVGADRGRRQRQWRRGGDRRHRHRPGSALPTSANGWPRPMEMPTGLRRERTNAAVSALSSKFPYETGDKD